MKYGMFGTQKAKLNKIKHIKLNNVKKIKLNNN